MSPTRTLTHIHQLFPAPSGLVARWQLSPMGEDAALAEMQFRRGLNPKIEVEEVTQARYAFCPVLAIALFDWITVSNKTNEEIRRVRRTEPLVYCSSPAFSCIRPDEADGYEPGTIVLSDLDGNWNNQTEYSDRAHYMFDGIYLNGALYSDAR